MGDSGPREACESAATAMVPLLLLLVTAHALVLPDVVEDVADAVQVQIPVANASASLQGRTVALGFEVGAHLALHARLPTALAENPAWLPDTEQIQEFSPKQAGQRLGFFVSAHVIAWILLCLIGTTIMTRCCGTCTDPSGYESVAPLQSGDESGDGTDPSGYESVTSAARPLVYGDDVWRAFFGTYLISLVAVFASLRFNRLSKATGLDFEVYLVLFVLQGTRLLGQAVTATRSLGPARRFPIDTFTVGAVAATMPFMADSFDTLKDVVFGALCIMSDSWELRLAGFASLVWLPCVHYMLLRVDIECLADLSGSYFPFASAQPANDESDESEAAEGEGCCWPKVEKSLHELYKQTTPGKIRLLLWGSRAAGRLCSSLRYSGRRVEVCHLDAAGSSTSPSSLWLALQRAARPLDHALHRQTPGRCFLIRQPPAADIFAGNYPACRGRAPRNSPGRSAQGHHECHQARSSF